MASHLKDSLPKFKGQNVKHLPIVDVSDFLGYMKKDGMPPSEPFIPTLRDDPGTARNKGTNLQLSKESF